MKQVASTYVKIFLTASSYFFFNYIVSEAGLLLFFPDDANLLIFHYENFLLTYELSRSNTARITQIVMSRVFGHLLVKNWIHRMYKRDLHVQLSWIPIQFYELMRHLQRTTR
jgi:hypothetical protein